MHDRYVFIIKNNNPDINNGYYWVEVVSAKPPFLDGGSYLAHPNSFFRSFYKW